MNLDNEWVITAVTLHDSTNIAATEDKCHNAISYHFLHFCDKLRTSRWPRFTDIHMPCAAMMGEVLNCGNLQKHHLATGKSVTAASEKSATEMHKLVKVMLITRVMLN